MAEIHLKYYCITVQDLKPTFYKFSSNNTMLSMYFRLISAFFLLRDQSLEHYWIANIEWKKEMNLDFETIFKIKTHMTLRP